MNILVTGGTSAVGRVLVGMLAGRGHHVCFTYHRNHELARQLCRAHDNVEGRLVDFTQPESVASLAGEVAQLDVEALVNNAYVGTPMGTHFHRTPMADFAQAFKANVEPVVTITQACIAAMRRKRAGRIVTVGSLATTGQPPAGYSVYAATKAYLQQLAKSWHSEYSRLGIWSACVLPDFMATALHGDLVEHLAQQQLAHHSRLLTPDEVALAIVRLLEGEAPFEQTQTITVN